MAKNEFRLENYIGSSQGQEPIRCWFRMRSGTAGLFADKKRCGLCEEDRCVLCDREEVEDVLHFLVLCDEFEWERQRLLKRIGDIEGSDMWLEEFTQEDHVGKMAMLLGRRVVGMDRMAAGMIENVIMAEVLRWWKQRKELIFYVQTPYNPSLWTPLKPLNPHRLQQFTLLIILALVCPVLFPALFPA